MKACGVSSLREVDPFDQEAAIDAVKAAAQETGVRAIIFRSPCIALERSKNTLSIDTKKCIGCFKCIKQLGCPALSKSGDKAVIDKKLCTSCGLCATVCPKDCMEKEDK